MSLTNEGEVDWRAVGPVLDEAIDELREADRRAVVLSFFEQRTFAEIGEAMNVGEDGARRRVERALERLRLALDRRKIRSSVAALAFALAANGVTAAPGGLAAKVGSAAAAIAPVAVTPMSVWLAFMTTTKSTIGLGSLAVIFTAAFVARPPWQEARAAERVHAELVGVLAQSRLERTRLDEQLKQSEGRLERLETAVAARSNSALSSQSTNTPEQKGEALLHRYPYLREAFDAWLDARSEADWGPFLSARSATTEQRQAFLRLMRESAALAVQDGNEGTWYARVTPPHGEAFHARVREMFGEDGARELRRYRQQEGARKVVAQAAGALSLIDEPLRPDQVDELVRALAANGGGGRTPVEVDPARLQQTTATFLSGRQQELVVAGLHRAQKQAEIERLRRRS